MSSFASQEQFIELLQSREHSDIPWYDVCIQYLDLTPVSQPQYDEPRSSIDGVRLPPESLDLSLISPKGTHDYIDTTTAHLQDCVVIPNVSLSDLFKAPQCSYDPIITIDTPSSLESGDCEFNQYFAPQQQCVGKSNEVNPSTIAPSGADWSLPAQSREHGKSMETLPFRCTFRDCNARLARPDTLRRHLSMHQRQPKHECAYCKQDGMARKFRRKEHLQQHVQRLHKVKSDGFRWSLPSGSTDDETLEELMKRIVPLSTGAKRMLLKCLAEKTGWERYVMVAGS
ncbi:hypothetical protein AMS68_007855 [Peltaster fructicola]|uniref:C2H2-type domain-containing protein n=1 Tax=Peltaster fructicola TaxID=286661 RepID=A0A6H0Y658_9PEZI|nr:hypothetical protein AMS68_007855 [Peltaster fructicola]